jgi:hypothetical protein
MNYAKLFEINSYFTWHMFSEVGKTHDWPNKIWQSLGDTLAKLILQNERIVSVLKRRATIKRNQAQNTLTTSRLSNLIFFHDQSHDSGLFAF